MLKLHSGCGLPFVVNESEVQSRRAVLFKIIKVKCSSKEHLVYSFP